MKEIYKYSKFEKLIFGKVIYNQVYRSNMWIMPIFDRVYDLVWSPKKGFKKIKIYDF